MTPWPRRRGPADQRGLLRCDGSRTKGVGVALALLVRGACQIRGSWADADYHTQRQGAALPTAFPSRFAGLARGAARRGTGKPPGTDAAPRRQHCRLPQALWPSPGVVAVPFHKGNYRDASRRRGPVTARTEAEAWRVGRPPGASVAWVGLLRLDRVGVRHNDPAAPPAYQLANTCSAIGAPLLARRVKTDELRLAKPPIGKRAAPHRPVARPSPAELRNARAPGNPAAIQPRPPVSQQWRSDLHRKPGLSASRWGWSP